MSSYEVGNVGGRLDRQTVSVITTTGIPLSQSCTMSSPPAQAPTSKANLKKKKKIYIHVIVVQRRKKINKLW